MSATSQVVQDDVKMKQNLRNKNMIRKKHLNCIRLGLVALFSTMSRSACAAMRS